MKTSRILTVLFCAVTITALYGCGRSGYLSEYPSEAGGATPISVVGGLSPESINVAKDESFFSGGAVSFGSEASGACLELFHQVTGTIEDISLSYTGDPYHMPLMKNNDAAEYCIDVVETEDGLEPRESPDHCLDYHFDSTDYTDSLVLEGNILCGMLDQDETLILSFNIMVDAESISTQKTEFGSYLIKLQQTVFDPFGMTSVAGDAWSQMEIIKDAETGGCSKDVDGSLGIDFDWSDENPESPWYNVTDQIDSDTYLDVAQTTPNLSEEIFSAACNLTYKIPVSIDIGAACQSNEQFLSVVTIDAASRIGLNMNYTDVEAVDFEGID